MVVLVAQFVSQGGTNISNVVRDKSDEVYIGVTDYDFNPHVDLCSPICNTYVG